MPLEQRLYRRVEQQGKCRIWTGAVEGTGYGLIRVGKRTQLVHRVAFDLLRGPIPAGLELDHLCFNRRCVRLDHLEPVTPAENKRRRRAVQTGAAHV